jgi:3-dehydroquinate dehydratase II
MEIWIINGPNLNLLGKREPNIYGGVPWEDVLEGLRRDFSDITFTYKQSNREGQLIDWLHESSERAKGVVLNAGGYTHTSIALGDAIAAIEVPVVEVHISNIHKREAFRQKSFIAPHCAGTISGFGLSGYRLAVGWFLHGALQAGNAH